ncbi:hypothetical protein CHARACLAT_031502 [Characodon lateralis]|uniref:Uncharacterized protein n=1 Tax=Characodon lateralis TaxID=208331 RepID=A0ABU7DVU3_9TELE|nr:hypothetical protein [Characodon lateralis]
MFSPSPGSSPQASSFLMIQVSKPPSFPCRIKLQLTASSLLGLTGLRNQTLLTLLRAYHPPSSSSGKPPPRINTVQVTSLLAIHQPQWKKLPHVTTLIILTTYLVSQSSSASSRLPDSNHLSPLPGQIDLAGASISQDFLH